MEIYDFLKSWKRMCNSMTEMNGCEDCQIVRNTHGARCGDMPCEMQDVESIAREVEKWAAEHPEPVYPTWREWLIKLGIISFEPDFHSLLHPEPTTVTNAVKAYLNKEGSKPIPADIAEKLGLKPR